MSESPKSVEDSSKLSTDHLICKSPKTSECSVQSLDKNQDDSSLLLLGTLQFLFGFLLVIFGGLVLHYDASLSQLGAGIWAGCLIMGTGIIGLLASAQDWCPLKSTPQKITHTIFLALSLVSLAIAQLVVALAATGAARDINSSEYEVEAEATTTTMVPPGRISIVLPINYMSILCNLGLLVISAAEFVVAAIASYKSSRILCPCFRKGDFAEDLNQKNAFVSSWLGKQSPIYVVAGTNSTLNKSHQGLPVPVFRVPQMVHQYPLIPAPLGTIPSPIIAPSHQAHKKKQIRRPQNIPKVKKSQAKAKKITEADVVRTYTGLDKAIAEEFIEICDSRNASLSSGPTSQKTCSQCSSTSEVASREYLVDNKVSEL